MESIGGSELRSMPYGDKNTGIGLDSYQLTEEFQRLMAAPPVSSNSFTALLEMPANQAMELLHSPETEVSSAARLSAAAAAGSDIVKRQNLNNQIPYNHTLDCAPAFPSNTALIERAAKYSVFANVDGAGGGSCSGGGGQDSPETSSAPSNPSANAMKVKTEPADTGSNPNSSSDPTVVSNGKSMKRKDREKKGKTSSKKTKTAAKESPEDGEKLPYVHVRARRGQATDSHSLAERARREKINARMKLLQELVPGCNKISGTALVLDEIINHVQSLQRQVAFLSMKLAAVNPRIDFNLDSLLMAGNGSVMDSNLPHIVSPLMWPDVQINGERQQCQQQWVIDSLHQPVWPREPDHNNLITPENSLLSYDSSANSASLPSSQLKMEL